MLLATAFQVDVWDKRVMSSSHPDDQGHDAGIASAKAPSKISSQGSRKHEQWGELTLWTEAQAAPNVVFSINDKTQNFEESQCSYKLVTHYQVLS